MIVEWLKPKQELKFWIYEKSLRSLKFEWNQIFFLFSVILLIIGSGFGITAGAHRLWSHKAYKAHWQLRLILIFLFTIAGQVISNAYQIPLKLIAFVKICETYLPLTNKFLMNQIHESIIFNQYYRPCYLYFPYHLSLFHVSISKDYDKLHVDTLKMLADGIIPDYMSALSNIISNCENLFAFDF